MNRRDALKVLAATPLIGVLPAEQNDLCGIAFEEISASQILDPFRGEVTVTNVYEVDWRNCFKFASSFIQFPSVQYVTLRPAPKFGRCRVTVARLLPARPS